MSDNALLPCPFCGGTKIHVQEREAGTLVSIRCRARDCGLEKEFQWRWNRDTETKLVDQAVAAWNRRALDQFIAAARATIERLTRELDEARSNETAALEQLKISDRIRDKLIAEGRRLERAEVVAWLKQVGNHLLRMGDDVPSRAVHSAAYIIEDGRHV